MSPYKTEEVLVYISLLLEENRMFKCYISTLFKKNKNKTVIPVFQ